MARLTLFNIGICLVVAIGSFAYGFGFAVFITAIGEPGFYVYFNLDRESTCIERRVLFSRADLCTATSKHTARYSLYSL